MSEGKAKLAVFVSGTGSNLQALVHREQIDVAWPAEIVAVVSDKPDCLGVAFAKEQQLAVLAKQPKDFSSKAEFEQHVLGFLTENKVDYIVLAGYMRLIGPVLLNAYPKRIFNIHPSLLPAFPGKQAVVDAYEAGVLTTGVTVHFIDEGIDTGPILAQMPVDVDQDKGIEELYKRIHMVEHQLYGDVIAQVVTDSQRP